MGKLPNPYDALPSLEAAIASGEIVLQKGVIDPTVGLTVDRPNGETRLTYVRMHGRKVVALLMMSPCEPVEGETCFNLGWAVAKKYRGQGAAQAITNSGLAEMARGMKGQGLKSFYVEAVVGLDNPASLRVAEKTISATPKDGVDKASRVPMRQFLKRVVCA